MIYSHALLSFMSFRNLEAFEAKQNIFPNFVVRLWVLGGSTCIRRIRWNLS